MALAVGSRLGPYEILAPLGAGGMGEVYRARDPRLARDVAIKVLPPLYSDDSDRLRRFEQEAKAAGVLNHPNITAVYDIGRHDGSPYVVQELLEGETLRSALAGGRLSVKTAIHYALQIALGLAAAHDKGIVDRDLKPENLFVTRSGRVKILDFGLAKLTRSEPRVGPESNLPTATAGTEPGVILGTLGYMSPEQVRGSAADARSDIFALGAIFYEMLSGRRAFRGESAADTMSAILKEDPPDLSLTNESVSPGLERIVRHCLEKNPEQRFRSASDLAFDLEAISTARGRQAEIRANRVGQKLVSPLLKAGVVVLTLAVGLILGRQTVKKPEMPSFQQLTFRRGSIWAARFAPDGRTIVYSATQDGGPVRLFSTRPESPESAVLPFPQADLLSISSSSELAISLGAHLLNNQDSLGILARVPLAGQAPREILENVQRADWAPDGNSLAIVRDVAGKNRLEFPIGKVLFETSGSITYPRFSPRGDSIAFVEHPVRSVNVGSVVVIDLGGGKKTLFSRGWGHEGLAWSPSGDEVWFTASRPGKNDLEEIHAATLSGNERLVYRAPLPMVLDDISRDGRVLFERQSYTYVTRGASFPETIERDLSWLSLSAAADVSGDGKTLLVGDYGEGSGSNYAVGLRKMDGSPPIRLGEGWAQALSPDRKWALAILPHPEPAQLILIPTGAGESKTLPPDSINHTGAWWFPDGTRILFTGSEPGHAARTYVQDLAGGKPIPITEEGVTGGAISPDGKFFLGARGDRDSSLYPTEGGKPRSIPSLSDGEQAIRWATDDSLFTCQCRRMPARIYRLDLSTGRKELWKELTPPEPVSSLSPVVLTADGQSYAYTYPRASSDLFLVKGLK